MLLGVGVLFRNYRFHLVLSCLSHLYVKIVYQLKPNYKHGMLVGDYASLEQHNRG